MKDGLSSSPALEALTPTDKTRQLRNIERRIAAHEAECQWLLAEDGPISRYRLTVEHGRALLGQARQFLERYKAAIRAN